MSEKIYNVINFIDKVVKEVIVFTGSTVMDAYFIKVLGEILMAYCKNSKVVRIITIVLSTLAAPIFIKLMRKNLGYSEEDCKNIYDVIKDVCVLSKLKKDIESIESA